MDAIATTANHNDGNDDDSGGGGGVRTTIIWKHIDIVLSTFMHNLI